MSFSVLGSLIFPLISRNILFHNLHIFVKIYFIRPLKNMTEFLTQPSINPRRTCGGVGHFPFFARPNSLYDKKEILRYLKKPISSSEKYLFSFALKEERRQEEEEEKKKKKKKKKKAPGGTRRRAGRQKNQVSDWNAKIF